MKVISSLIQNQWKRSKRYEVHSLVLVAWKIDLAKITIDFNSLFIGKICGRRRKMAHFLIVKEAVIIRRGARLRMYEKPILQKRSSNIIVLIKRVG